MAQNEDCRTWVNSPAKRNGFESFSNHKSANKNILIMLGPLSTLVSLSVALRIQPVYASETQG